MSQKKLFLLTFSFLLFIIVLTMILKTNNFKRNDEVFILSLSSRNDYLGMVKSYNYVKNEDNNLVYNGKMTGYGADCNGCSGTGGLSCRAKNGSRHTLSENGMYYNDEEFGEVRIVAAALDAFPCGTIVKIDNCILEPFYAVVMDTGYSVKNAWNNGIVWMDLAFITENDEDLYAANSSNVTYNVQRLGW